MLCDSSRFDSSSPFASRIARISELFARLETASSIGRTVIGAIDHSATLPHFVALWTCSIRLSHIIRSWVRSLSLALYLFLLFDTHATTVSRNQPSQKAAYYSFWCCLPFVQLDPPPVQNQSTRCLSSDQLLVTRTTASLFVGRHLDKEEKKRRALTIIVSLSTHKV